MSDIQKKVQLTVTKFAIVGKKCDMCGADILPISRTFPRKPNPYLEITTHHNDWGNDSGESYAHYHACSVMCAMKFTAEYLAKNFDDINSTEIEIKHEDGWMLPEGEEA